MSEPTTMPVMNNEQQLDSFDAAANDNNVFEKQLLAVEEGWSEFKLMTASLPRSASDESLDRLSDASLSKSTVSEGQTSDSGGSTESEESISSNEGLEHLQGALGVIEPPKPTATFGGTDRPEAQTSDATAAVAVEISHTDDGPSPSFKFGSPPLSAYEVTEENDPSYDTMVTPAIPPTYFPVRDTPRLYDLISCRNSLVDPSDPFLSPSELRGRRVPFGKLNAQRCMTVTRSITTFDIDDASVTDYERVTSPASETSYMSHGLRQVSQGLQRKGLKGPARLRLLSPPALNREKFSILKALDVIAVNEPDELEVPLVMPLPILRNDAPAAKFDPVYLRNKMPINELGKVSPPNLSNGAPAASLEPVILAYKIPVNERVPVPLPNPNNDAPTPIFYPVYLLHKFSRPAYQWRIPDARYPEYTSNYDLPVMDFLRVPSRSYVEAGAQEKLLEMLNTGRPAEERPVYMCTCGDPECDAGY